MKSMLLLTSADLHSDFTPPTWQSSRDCAHRIAASRDTRSTNIPKEKNITADACRAPRHYNTANNQQRTTDSKSYDLNFTNNPTNQPNTNIEMKTDNYLTLCLEQATKSPLHYRHGCIIVRGGKIIGQGHNDYRPGFDGGALKHGRVASSVLNGPALAEMKAKLKQRKEEKSKPKDAQQKDTEDFVPFEKANGGGPQANTPLSMHSEMMAIHSALSTSSTMACSTFSRKKPSFKLPRGDKKKERLRRDVLKSYVERICENTGIASKSTAHGQGGKLQVQECRFENSTSQRSGGTRASQQQQRPPRGPAGAAAGRRGQGLSGREEYGEACESEREEERQTEQVRAVRASERPVWETDTVRFFAGTFTTTTALCV